MQAAVLNRNVKGIELIFFQGVGIGVLQGIFRAWVLAKVERNRRFTFSLEYVTINRKILVCQRKTTPSSRSLFFIVKMEFLQSHLHIFGPFSSKL